MADDTAMAELDASRLTRTLNDNPRPLPPLGSIDVRLLNYHTDHMIVATWNASTGWSTPSLQPYAPIPLAPAITALQYATSCFEGLKLLRGSDGRLRLFRPMENCHRMRRSAAQTALPDFDPAELEKLIVALCAQEGPKWLPKDQGEGALYLRPTMIGTDTALATLRPRSAMLYIFCVVFPKIPSSLTGKDAPAPQQKKPSMKLLASSPEQIRAWPGGYGDKKVGANYGPTIAQQGDAKARGYDQILYLFGPEGRITEAGISNFFIVLRTDETMWELATPPLDDGLILPGVTRDSILQLAKTRLQGAAPGGLKVDVAERQITMTEVAEAHAQGRIVEAFVSGTGLFITSVGLISWEGKDLEINTEPVNGFLCSDMIKSTLLGIMNGKEEHEWTNLVDEP